MERYLKTNVCPLPWTHLEVDVNGGASPCCLYKGSVPDVKVYNESLKNIQKHQAMRNVALSFLEDYSNPMYADPAFWGNFSIGYNTL